MIKPHALKTSEKGSWPTYPLAIILRVHLLQQWYSLSDPAMQEDLIQPPSMRWFAGIELITNRITDETTALTFRHLLEKTSWGRSLRTPNPTLNARYKTMGQGAIVCTTLNSVPISINNKERKGDPEMHQTKNGNQFYF
jgi:IS5 family transposase